MSVRSSVRPSHFLVIFTRGKCTADTFVSASVEFRKSVHGFWKNLQKLALAKHGCNFWDPVLDPFLGPFLIIFAKKYPNRSFAKVREMMILSSFGSIYQSNKSQSCRIWVLRATCPAGWYLVLSRYISCFDKIFSSTCSTSLFGSQEPQSCRTFGRISWACSTPSTFLARTPLKQLDEAKFQQKPLEMVASS